MTKFNAGNTIVDKYGNSATVLSSMESVSIRWHGWDIPATHPANMFELMPRKFSEGQYVRIIAEDPTKGLIGYIFEDDGDPEDEDPYWVMLFNEEGEESPYSADEMIPWVPLVGERVIEDGVEDDETGVVIGINETGTEGGVDDVSVRVLWDSFPHAQNWFVADLAPADELTGEIAVGDIVTYSNPIFTDTPEAEVMDVIENIIFVNFQPGTILPNGAYSKDFFSKKVA